MRENTQRGWGPFTGAQLTIMFVTLVVVVAFPFAASAVTNSTVSLTDAVSGSQASVTKAGALIVAPASPLALTRGRISSPGSGYVPLIKPGSGKALVVTSVTLDTFTNNSPGATNVVAFAISKTDATCGSLTLLRLVHPGSIGLTTVPFGAGVIVPAGRALCVAQPSQVNFGNTVDAFGYTIPAASAPAGG